MASCSKTQRPCNSVVVGEFGQDQARLHTVRETGFSLASIFFLTAVVAVFASGVRMASLGPGRIDPETLGGLAFCGVIVGVLVGGTVASRTARSTTSKALAVLAGASFGPPSMILAVTGNALPVILMGSAVLFVFVWVVRRLSSHESGEEPL